MKNILGVLASITFVTASYALPNYEPFADATATPPGTAYTATTDLIGQTNAQGLTWYRVGAAAPTTIINSGSLTVSGLATSGGNSAKIIPSATSTYSRFAMDSIVNSGTIYYSMAFQITDLGTTLQSAGAFFATFHSAGAASQTTAVPTTTLAGRTLVRPKVFGDANAGFEIGTQKVGNASDQVWYTGQTFNTSDTIFVVVGYTFNAGASDDVVKMWINPLSSTFGSGSAPTETLITTTATTDNAQIGSLFLTQRANNLNPNVIIVDDLRIGTTWADVTPQVPEPTSAWLAGLGLLALRGWCRSRRC